MADFIYNQLIKPSTTQVYFRHPVQVTTSKSTKINNHILKDHITCDENLI